MDAMRKVSKVLCVLGTTSFLMMPASFAAIPVIDADNILQQAKTYGETIKVVTNTAKTLELVILDHMGMSKEDKEAFQKKFDNGINKVTAILNNQNTPLGKMRIKTRMDDPNDPGMTIDELDAMYRSQFPDLAKDSGGCFGTGEIANPVKIVDIWKAYRSHNWQAIGSLMTNNKETLKQYSELMQELDAAMKDLQTLQNASNNAQGIMQAQQIANDIQATNARIDNIRTTLGAIKAQNDLMKSQAEAQKQMNQMVLDKAVGEANVDYVSQLNTDNLTYTIDPDYGSW